MRAQILATIIVAITQWLAKRSIRIRRLLNLIYDGCGSSSLAAQSVSPAAARQEAIGSVKAW